MRDRTAARVHHRRWDTRPLGRSVGGAGTYEYSRWAGAEGGAEAVPHLELGIAICNVPGCKRTYFITRLARWSEG